MVAVSQFCCTQPLSSIVSHKFSVENSAVCSLRRLKSAQFSADVYNYDNLSCKSIYAGHSVYGKTNLYDAVLYRRYGLVHVITVDFLFFLVPSIGQTTYKIVLIYLPDQIAPDARKTAVV